MEVNPPTMSTPQALQHLYSLDASSPDLLRYLYYLIRTDEEEQYLTSLRGSELTSLVDFLDEILGVAPKTDDVFGLCLQKLQAICSDHAILPFSCTISGDFLRAGDYPVALGAFCDVWEGNYSGSKVCVKRSRITEQSREAVEKAFCEETIIWKRLRHPNLVAFIGVAQNPLQFVSEWMPNGNIREYVNENPSANRVGLLLDVAEGLNYLHANHATHGDLKGPNILIDCNGHARLTDFGFASVLHRLSSSGVTISQGYTPGRASPEVLVSGERITPEADVFAFGILVVEVFTGEYPFSGPDPGVIIAKTAIGERPDRPQDPGLTDSVWDVTCACWHQDPAHRPTVTGVVRTLRECYKPYTTVLQPSNLTQPQPAKWVEPDVIDHSDYPTVHSAEYAIYTSKYPTAKMPLGFVSAYQRINKTAEELAKENQGPRGKRYNELLKFCTRWHTVPVSYELDDVVTKGAHAQQVSRVTEIWEGVHDGHVVALKVLRLPQDDPDIKTAQERFCTIAVLMKQLNHINIIPFYGVSPVISEFSLVFPWYRNGNIEQYLEKNRGVNPYDLLIGAANGLLFLHSNEVVHGALRPSHVLIDDDGIARLTIAVHGTSSIHHAEPSSAEDIKDCSYMAPETLPVHHHPPRGWIKALFTGGRRRTSNVTMASDVYELAIVIHEVLTGIAPHFESRYNDLTSVVIGRVPARADGMIDDSVLQLLQKCWSKTPRDRPTIVDVHRSLAHRPKVIYAPRSPSVIGEMPGALNFRVQSIKITSDLSHWKSVFVRIKYGNEKYKTPPTMVKNTLGEYIWNRPENWVMRTTHRQRISLVVMVQTGPFKWWKSVFAEGDLSLINSANKNIMMVLRNVKRRSETVEVKVVIVAT